MRETESHQEIKPSEGLRRRRVALSAKVADVVARVVITLGGIGVIVTVFGVFVYLLLVVVPLFRPGNVVLQARVPAPNLLIPPEQGAAVISSSESAGRDFSESPQTTPFKPDQAAEADSPPEHRSVSDPKTAGNSNSICGLFSDESVRMLVVVGHGWARAIALPSGQVIGEFPSLVEGSAIVGWRFHAAERRWFASLSSGELVVGRWEFEVTFPDPTSLPASVQSLRVGESTPFESGIITHTSPKQFQLTTGRPVEEFRTQLGGEPLVLLDGVDRPSGTVVIGLDRTGTLRTSQIVRQKNLLTGKVTTRVVGGQAKVDSPEETFPQAIFLFGQGDGAVVVWGSGKFCRYDLNTPTEPRLVEEGDFSAKGLGEISAGSFLLGKNTLILAHGSGMLSGWFLTPAEDGGARDGRRLVAGLVLGEPGLPVRTLTMAHRSRLLAGCRQNGEVALFYATSQRLLARWELPSHLPALAMAFSPRDDYLFVATSEGIDVATVNVSHPEVSWRSIWRRVWYEGYPKPAFVWQSTGGTDNFEPKYSLVPLVFGTLKATFYSLLFGLPLALLGAIYTSEFLHPDVRARVKPAVEMMASLPSVVLGFVAAFVVAPIVEKAVTPVLCFFATVPLALVACGIFWEMMPQRVRVNGYLRGLGLISAIGLGAVLAWGIGPAVELVLFGGDIKRWLAGREGAGWGGWVLMWLPAAVIMVMVFHSVLIAPVVYSRLETQSRIVAAFWRLLQLAIYVVVICLLAVGLAYLSNLLLGDPRGSLLGSYVQRNALVVGIIMGFAIIPIIFTLSEDALSAVPQELRAASLGAGATPWQTAFRVVIPAAMSGLFSAAMVGLGRAAGETMIVLMAAGNTPILEWNPFNGFRTLSANIAVELPEAVQGSTHYRMLFLAALCLFVMTSVVNTIAELVRLRFRKQTARL